ncbi:UNVERIFIED_CONTAM: hypothetical protein FKN15_052295 [Acipenser sinensis]
MSPDNVTSDFTHTSAPKKREAVTSLVKFHKRQALKKKRQEEEERQVAAKELIALAGPSDPQHYDDQHVDSEDEPTTSSISSADDDHVEMKKTVTCQTNMAAADISALQEVCQRLQTENLELKFNLDLIFRREKPLRTMTKKLNPLQVCQTIL